MNLYFILTTFMIALRPPLLFSVCIMYKFPVKNKFYVHLMVESHPVLLLSLNNGSLFLLNTFSHILYLHFFQNSQPQSVLKLFLISTQRWGSWSYKMYSYKKKRVYFPICSSVQCLLLWFGSFSQFQSNRRIG